MMKGPSEVQAKTVGEVVLTWNRELEHRTNFFVARAKALADWDRHILKNRHQLMALQVDLGKASSSQDRLERQLDILQVHQKEICDALGVMEAEAEHLARSSQPRDDPGSASQETLYTLAETISAHLSNLGDVLHGIVPAGTSADDGGTDAHASQRPPSESTLQAHLQSLHSIEQKIGYATAALM
mmetsp:Transcript_31093/g.77895  ORF Transcript_31093/g.77895 Transcript_31093/m.77895 type:complete len:185 (-) Transcript_31093:176-730(-)|eukprot:CAMPEP_0181377352 /NCGR_PEP_ID=MMETSP1106-20121128/17852_1 /TAXON_ID=81844 /ORGANISM="Mantoniella antarctica, Strain SL-175" /LENGTH=184 /DNA_ID=CAMNT_0023496083 /DNA_START=171 /DNA_END=725 /DNA_ORIENTATION=-